jgi:hypothetical protein
MSKDPRPAKGTAKDTAKDTAKGPPKTPPSDRQGNRQGPGPCFMKLASEKRRNEIEVISRT